ncbi:hypothetical protein AB0B89_12080, partial [Sphaerisporangium sp. NPDC049002]
MAATEAFWVSSVRGLVAAEVIRVSSVWGLAAMEVFRVSSVRGLAAARKVNKPLGDYLRKHDITPRRYFVE